MNILVTGGLGFIGSHLVDHLIRDRHEVLVIDNLSTGDKKNINTKAHYVYKDLKIFIETDSELKELITRHNIQVIYHLAANASVNSSLENPLMMIEENFNASVALIEAAKNTNVRKFLFSSTSAVYGEPIYYPVDENHSTDPLTPYGLSKLLFEKYLYYFKKTSDISIVAFRLPNVYGPRQRFDLEGGVVAIFNEKIKSNENVTIYGDGEQKRDWVFVGDIVAAFQTAINADISFDIISIASGVSKTVNELFLLTKRKYNYKKQPIMKKARDGDITKMVMDNKKAKKILGWEAKVDLAVGISLIK